MLAGVAIVAVLAASADWTFTPAQDGAQGGRAVAATDVNGDGYADLAVSAYFEDVDLDGGAPEADVGRVYVFLGGPSGLAAAPAAVYSGDVAGGAFGNAIAGCDVDGDGFGDFVVGAPNLDAGSTDEGRIYLFRGSAEPLATTPVWTAEPNAAGALLGSSVDCGDVDADGKAEIASGARGQDRVYVYRGDAAPTLWTTVIGEQAGSNFGTSIAMGDFNRDGRADLLAGAVLHTQMGSTAGKAYLHLGTATGISTSFVWGVRGEANGARFGVVANAGDVDGDGYPDAAVGSYLLSTARGKVYLFKGAAAGLEPTAAWTFLGDITDSNHGAWVDSAGDVNADGYGDLLVGASVWESGVATDDEGRLLLFLGGSGGLPAVPNWTIGGGDSGAVLGLSGMAADFDADGFADVAGGANLHGATDRGRAFAWYAIAQAIQNTSVSTIESNSAGAHAGSALAGGGDANGDGFQDLAAGAPDFGGTGRVYLHLGGMNGLGTVATFADGSAGSLLGSSLAMGDVDGDGFSDVIAGAPGVAQVRIYRGNAATGMSSTPDWTLSGPASFGTSVAALDIDADGWIDIVAGAPDVANGESSEGRVYLHRGSAAGPELVAGWTWESDLASAQAGRAVASAGDVNGDGPIDLIVGAPGAGRAYVFLGAWGGTPGPSPWETLTGGASTGFGTAVAGAGDTDGDGLADVVIGAPDFEGATFTDEGQATVFLGGATEMVFSFAWSPFVSGARAGTCVSSFADLDGDGLSDPVVGTPGIDAVTVFPSGGAAKTLSGSAGSSFGAACTSQSDVDGDGFGEVIAGAPLRGNGELAEGEFRVFQGNTARGRPVLLRQVRADDSRLVQLGGRTGVDGEARLRVRAASPYGGGCALGSDPRTCTRVQVEFRRGAFGWSAACVPDSTGACLTGAPVPANTDSPFFLTGLSANRYHWRARVLYPAGSPQKSSRWLEYPDPNARAETDFFAVSDARPLGMKLSGLAAKRLARGVEISWSVDADGEVARMQPFRETSPIGEAFVVPEAGSFAVIDAAGRPGDRWFVKAEGMDGVAEWFGPVTLEAAPATGGCNVDRTAGAGMSLFGLLAVGLAIAIWRVRS